MQWSIMEKMEPNLYIICTFTYLVAGSSLGHPANQSYIKNFVAILQAYAISIKE